ncbi:RNA polymerase sigma-70 factor (ECF subfamily) [Friedmanniella endophytica]|uniref:RNA polymerase sigma-70 factor (ECF subfamily) n=1 Tax=Microlunatus kandeliicorticis TaxID=1759536 RepID=A0A7W3IP11_9ACTN|nr:ECF RNA polymerase sigma factor SigK [Microlunatus kandeliicorticis]MBA8792610.1 RNA polymerase sigma-70 factor (ECF subfamily) [Microlunatus kandeliicorticis]
MSGPGLRDQGRLMPLHAVPDGAGRGADPGRSATDPAVAASAAGAATSGPELNVRLTTLLAASARGDEQAFAELYDVTNARMYGVILRVLRAVDHATEVTQEFYVEVWRQAGRYDRSRGSVLAWMTTMAHRRAVDRVRTVTSDTARDDRYARETEPRAFDQVWGEVEQSLDRQRVRSALEGLTPVQREAVTLTYFGGYTHVQAAELLQVPLGTVKTRIRDGLIRLRDTLGIDHG